MDIKQDITKLVIFDAEKEEAKNKIGTIHTCAEV
jgi:hypothetical protein